VLLVGDDWVEDHHDVELVDDTGRRLARARLPEGLEGLSRLHALIAEHRPGEWADLPAEEAARRVTIGIETDRTRCGDSALLRPARRRRRHRLHRSVGDSYDNAQAESLIGLYKLECVGRDGPWRGVADLELATLSWVHWLNHQRLQSKIGYVRDAGVRARRRRRQPHRPARPVAVAWPGRVVGRLLLDLPRPPLTTHRRPQDRPYATVWSAPDPREHCRTLVDGGGDYSVPPWAYCRPSPQVSKGARMNFRR
jgi:Integrase core domain